MGMKVFSMNQRKTECSPWEGATTKGLSIKVINNLVYIPRITQNVAIVQPDRYLDTVKVQRKIGKAD